MSIEGVQPVEPRAWPKITRRNPDERPPRRHDGHEEEHDEHDPEQHDDAEGHQHIDIRV